MKRGHPKNRDWSINDQNINFTLYLVLKHWKLSNPLHGLLLLLAGCSFTRSMLQKALAKFISKELFSIDYQYIREKRSKNRTTCIDKCWVIKSQIKIYTEAVEKLRSNISIQNINQNNGCQHGTGKIKIKFSWSRGFKDDLD